MTFKNKKNGQVGTKWSKLYSRSWLLITQFFQKEEELLHRICAGFKACLCQVGEWLLARSAFARALQAIYRAKRDHDFEFFREDKRGLIFDGAVKGITIYLILLSFYFSLDVPWDEVWYQAGGHMHFWLTDQCNQYPALKFIVRLAEAFHNMISSWWQGAHWSLNRLEYKVQSWCYRWTCPVRDAIDSLWHALVTRYHAWPPVKFIGDQVYAFRNAVYAFGNMVDDWCAVCRGMVYSVNKWLSAQYHAWPPSKFIDEYLNDFRYAFWTVHNACVSATCWVGTRLARLYEAFTPLNFIVRSFITVGRVLFDWWWGR